MRSRVDSQMPKPPIAIIGAGVSGMAAAFALSKGGIVASVYEKSRGPSGRAATRRKHGVLYDHGANFFRLEDVEVKRLLKTELPANLLEEIKSPVFTFDRDGQIMPGDADLNRIAK